MAVPVSSVCELTRKRDDERNCCSLYRAVEDNTGFKIQDHRERSSHVLSGGSRCGCVFFCRFAAGQVFYELLHCGCQVVPVFHRKSDRSVIRLPQRAYLDLIWDALQDQVRQDADTHALFHHRHDGKVLTGGKTDVRPYVGVLQKVRDLPFFHRAPAAKTAGRSGLQRRPSLFRQGDVPLAARPCTHPA